MKDVECEAREFATSYKQPLMSEAGLDAIEAAYIAGFRRSRECAGFVFQQYFRPGSTDGGEVFQAMLKTYGEGENE